MNPKKRKWKLKVALLLVVGLAVGIWNFRFRSTGEETYELFTAVVERAMLENTIISTGKVDAMVTVDVGSQVTGQVQELYSNFNSIVTENQILAQLDPRNYQAQMRNSQANLSSARSRIETSRADRLNANASLASAESNLELARTELAQAETNVRRSESLHADGLVPDTEIESVALQLQTARARMTQQDAAVEQAEAQIISRDAAILQAEAALEQAEAALEEAELNLGYTTIRSPVAGVVISREVDVGQTVSASTSAPTLFKIANDLSRMQVEASIDEADIGLLGQENRVDFTVDAYPDETFLGEIEQIRLNPSTTQNVVTYAVIITFDNPGLKLKPGMTANLEITVSRKNDVLSVPNAALRYEPPPDESDDALENATDATNAADAGADLLASDPEDYSPDSELGISRASAVVAPATSLVSMPGQLWDTGEMIQFRSSPPPPPRAGRVWVVADEGSPPEMRRLMIGVSNGSRTEVVSGDLSVGDSVVIADSMERDDEEDEEDEDGRRTFTMRGRFQ